MNPQRRITPATYITISRFFLVPLFIYLFLKEHYLLALLVLGLAAFTDLLDGFMARRFNMRSRLGSMLDPLADKFLMVVSFIVMARLNIIPLWLTILVISKDFVVLTGAAILNLMKIRLYYKPTIISKLTTLSQIALLVFSFLQAYLHSRFNELQIFFSFTAAGMTLITLCQYTYIGYRFYRYGERKSGGPEAIPRSNVSLDEP